GYSGVALITKLKPERMVIGMQNHKYDAEGRVLRADFGDITMLGCYFPSGTTGDIRQTFKMEFLADFQAYVDELKKDRPNLIISGDLNIAHTEIDINHPKRHHKTSGFLPEERQWLTEFLKSGFIDSFRFIDDRAEQYSWWTYRANARAKNLGWRIDYNLVSESMQERICGASILQDIIHSDHCPVKVEIRQ
ncbi:MAG: exodeoxyribonuclease III, partial [Bacteroidota bacterium]